MRLVDAKIVETRTGVARVLVEMRGPSMFTNKYSVTATIADGTDKGREVVRGEYAHVMRTFFTFSEDDAEKLRNHEYKRRYWNG